MKTLAFAGRNAKEIVRDRLNLAFGIGFPAALLYLMSAIQANIPVSLFEIDRLAPGVAVFGLSFVSLFSGMLISKDRGSSFLMRLFASPLTSGNFIIGYACPFFLIAVAQSVICFALAFPLGLPINANILVALVVLMPTAVLFIGIGLLAGTVFTDKQVGGICGALLTNVSAWLSGAWFDLNLVGGAFKAIANALPFARATNATRAAVAGRYGDIFPDLWWGIAYAVAVFALAIVVFNRKMKSDVK